MKQVRDIEVRDSIPASAVFPERTPGTLLAGLRYRERLTQKELADETVIPKRQPGLAMSIERSKDDVRKTRDTFRKLASMAPVKDTEDTSEWRESHD